MRKIQKISILSLFAAITMIPAIAVAGIYFITRDDDKAATYTQDFCKAYGYLSSKPDNQVCGEITVGGKTCYNNCREATCADGYYLPSQPSGQTCTSITFAGKTCYKDCKSNRPDCSSYECHNKPGESTWECLTYEGGCCKTCWNPTCEDKGFLSSVPPGSKCKRIISLNKACYYRCDCDDSCPPGYTQTSCGRIGYYNGILDSVINDCGTTCNKCRTVD